ncbi:MAG: hypothetical protein ACK4PR_02680 [Gammaproteobacteria bacterium]
MSILQMKCVSVVKKLSNLNAANNFKKLIWLISLLTFGLSLCLSLIFWWSIGNQFAESILFVMFALVFELCKFISLPMAIKNVGYRGLISLNLMAYVLLTALSVLSSIGGIGSCLNNNQQRAVQSSSEYQTLTQQIAAEQTLINTELTTIQANLAHNYRTQALMMQNNIPQQQVVLNQLRQQREHINAMALPPSLSLLKMFSENFSVSFNNLQNLFIMVIAILIELISTYLILISMIGYKKVREESSPPKKMFSKISEIYQEASIYGVCEAVKQEPINSADNISEAPENIAGYPKNFLEKYEKVLENIKNNAYECKITEIMRHEKIGHKLARLIIEKLTQEEMHHAH